MHDADANQNHLNIEMGGSRQRVHKSVCLLQPFLTIYALHHSLAVTNKLNLDFSMSGGDK